jgi:dihydrofolate reductase
LRRPAEGKSHEEEFVITLVVAAADNGVIGRNGAVPWHIPADLKRFKALTLGKTVVMGRKTWDSLPRKPLPGRQNLVLTRDAGWRADGAVRAGDIETAVRLAEGAVMAIGGAEVYRLFLPRANCIELTEVHGDFAGDAVFGFDRADWRESARTEERTEDGLAYSYVTLIRK